MNKVGQITTIIKDQVERLPIREDQCLFNAPHILLISQSFPGVHWNTSLGNSSGSMILGRENVA